MPNESFHKKTEHWIVLGIIILAFLRQEQWLAWITLGAFISIFITPDMDISKLPLFWLYGKLCRHRHISHWPVIGTVTRIIYLGGIGSLIFILCKQMTFQQIWTIIWPIRISPFWLFFTGMIIIDIIHLIMDQI